MHKAGGIIALISGLLTIGAGILASLLAAADTGSSGRFSNPATAFAGGLAIASILIVLSIIMLNTSSRVPATLPLAFTLSQLMVPW